MSGRVADGLRETRRIVAWRPMMVTRRAFLVAVGLMPNLVVRATSAGALQKPKPKLATVTLTIDGMI